MGLELFRWVEVDVGLVSGWFQVALEFVSGCLGMLRYGFEGFRGRGLGTVEGLSLTDHWGGQANWGGIACQAGSQTDLDHTWRSYSAILKGKPKEIPQSWWSPPRPYTTFAPLRLVPGAPQRVGVRGCSAGE